MNSSQHFSLLQVATNSCSTVDKYDKIELIGAGTYGQVWKARERATNEIVALKRIRMETEKEGFPITAIREIKILKTCAFTNVIQLKEIITSPDPDDLNSVYLVFEYMEHDLAGLLDAEGFKKQFRIDHLKCYMKQLLEGLLFLHRSNILHRDIKSANLLINNQGMLKLADFGLARPIERRDAQIKNEKSMSSGSKYTNNVITLWYRPPELLLGAKHYGTAIDIWSAGCVFAEMYEKRSPFSGGHKLDSEQLELIWKLVGTPTPESWPTVEQLPLYKQMQPKRAYPSTLKERFGRHGKEALDLLTKLLTLDPDKRITADAALDDEYFFSEPEACHPSQVTPYLVSSHEYTSKSRRRKLHQIQEEGRQPQQQPPHSQPHNHSHHPHQSNASQPPHHNQNVDQGALKRLKTDHPPQGANQNLTPMNNSRNSNNTGNFPPNQNQHANPPYQQVNMNMNISMNVSMYEMNNANNANNRMQPSPMMQQGNPNFHGQGYPFQQSNNANAQPPQQHPPPFHPSQLQGYPQQPPQRNQPQYPGLHHNPNNMMQQQQFPSLQPPPINPYANHVHNLNGQLLPPPPNVDMTGFSAPPQFRLPPQQPQQPGTGAPLPSQPPPSPTPMPMQQQSQSQHSSVTPPQQLPPVTDPAVVQKKLAELNGTRPPSVTTTSATPKKPKNVLLGNSYQRTATPNHHANANSASLASNGGNNSNMLNQVKRESNETELMNLT